jgi:hypothetical protein
MTLSITDTQHSNALHYADCHILFIVMLSVFMLNIIMLNVVMLNVVMLSVVAPFLSTQSHKTFFSKRY